MKVILNTFGHVLVFQNLEEVDHFGLGDLGGVEVVEEHR